MRGTFRYLTLATGLFFAVAPSFAQDVRIKIPLTFKDHLGNTEIINFGVDTRATYCVDPALGEFELPPDACLPGYCGSWYQFDDPRGYNDSCTATGLILDLRPFYSPSQLDTFEVEMGCCDNIFPLTIHWPDTMNELFDSARMIDLLGGVFYNVDMLATDSEIIQVHIRSLYIMTWGPKSTVSVSSKNEMRPPQFALFQNYPNPFNPSTRIQYSIDKAQIVVLTVYDVFGRKVATLVDGRKPAGQYDVEWSGAGHATGAYFCRLKGERKNELTKMLLIR